MSERSLQELAAVRKQLRTKHVKIGNRIADHIENSSSKSVIQALEKKLQDSIENIRAVHEEIKLDESKCPDFDEQASDRWLRKIETFTPCHCDQAEEYLAKDDRRRREGRYSRRKISARRGGKEFGITETANGEIQRDHRIHPRSVEDKGEDRGFAIAASES